MRLDKAADPGWRCLVADDWPATADGRCYSMCLDVSGSRAHAPPHQTIDIIMLLLLPVVFDVYFLLTWLHGAALFKGIKGTISPARKLAFGFCSLAFLALGVVLLGLIRAMNGFNSPRDYPGALMTGVLCVGCGLFFFNLAVEDHCAPVRVLMKPWMRMQMWCVGIQKCEQAGPRHPIESDTSLCFFLVQVHVRSTGLLQPTGWPPLIRPMGGPQPKGRSSSSLPTHPRSFVSWPCCVCSARPLLETRAVFGHRATAPPSTT